MRPTLRLMGLVIASLLILGFYFMSIDWRYAWYLRGNDSIFLKWNEISCMLVISCLWAFFPSPILVVTVGLFGFISPPLYNSDTFVWLDLPYSIAIVVCLGLLFGVTWLWRRRRSRKAAVRGA